jgi:peptidoglycan hydrolase CwlO-like protein
MVDLHATHDGKLRVLFLLAVLSLMTSTATWASGHSRTHKAGSTPGATPASLAQAKAKLEQQQAQVKQLQSTVAKQESDSKQASDRMKQQDQAIAQMQQQLQALHGKQAAGHR